MCMTCLCKVTMPATRNQEDGPSSASSTESDCNDLPTAALLCTPHITGLWATQAPPTLQMRNGEAQRRIWAGYMLRYTVFLPSWAPPIKLANAARHVLLSTHEPHHSPHLLWPLRDKESKLGVQAWIKGLWWNFPSPWVTVLFVCLGWFWSGILLVVPPLSRVRCSYSLL